MREADPITRETPRPRKQHQRCFKCTATENVVHIICIEAPGGEVKSTCEACKPEGVEELRLNKGGVYMTEMQFFDASGSNAEWEQAKSFAS